MIDERSIKPIRITGIKGINNLFSPEQIPDGFLFNAVNIDILNTGSWRIREGQVKEYAGTDCHSLFDRYFIEGSDLKRLESDNTATVIQSSIGAEPMFYTKVDDIIYCSNGVVTGKIIDGSWNDWGIDIPTFHPVLGEAAGNLHAGTYQVCLSWITKDGEVSGAIAATSITVGDGAGISLTNFPPAPAEAIKVGIYMTGINDDNFYLNDEISLPVTSVTILDTETAIPLVNHFAAPLHPTTMLQEHYGRIYYKDERLLRFTRILDYNLVDDNNYLPLDSEITAIISLPGLLYVGTETGIYRISNIDLEGFPASTKIKPYGITLGSVCYDRNHVTAYALSERGIIALSGEGVSEITFNNVGMADYRQGATTVIHHNGLKKLVGVFQGGTVSAMQSKEYKASEITRKGDAF